jgi:glutamine phosphoribosylpyrophosphate amidotransferase
MTLSEMREFLGADSLAFLSEQTMVKVMNSGLESESAAQPQWCTACFSGKYGDAYAQAASNRQS